PLWLRISASDWTEGGWTIDDSIALARLVKPLGIDLIDSSSGGIVPNATIPLGPGYTPPLRRAPPPRGGNPNRSRRHDHRARAGPAHHRHRTGRYSPVGSPTPPRTLLAASCRLRPQAADRLAQTIRARLLLRKKADVVKERQGRRQT